MADVFPEPSVSREGALGWVEPSVHWFTEITRDIAVASRANVNHWYANFPDPDGAFSARLQSETDSEHLQAVDELLVHHLLSQRWGDVRYEEQGSGPDFRIYDSGGCYVGGIEVASLFEREDWSAEQRRYGRLADAVNDRIKPTAGYFLRLEIEGDRDPTSRKVVPFSSGTWLFCLILTTCRQPTERTCVLRYTTRMAYASRSPSCRWHQVLGEGRIPTPRS